MLYFCQDEMINSSYLDSKNNNLSYFSMQEVSMFAAHSLHRPYMQNEETYLSWSKLFLLLYCDPPRSVLFVTHLLKSIFQHF